MKQCSRRDFYMGGGIESLCSSSNIRRFKHKCDCNVNSPLMTCKEGPNYGFKMCEFSIWLDEELSELAQNVVSGLVNLVSDLNKI